MRQELYDFYRREIENLTELMWSAAQSPFEQGTTIVLHFQSRITKLQHRLHREMLGKSRPTLVDADRGVIEELRNNYHKTGQLFGYPKCCIKRFCKRLQLGGEMLPERAAYLNPLSGTGYTPCPRCAANLPDTLAYIAKHRHPALPSFPLNPTEEELKMAKEAGYEVR